MNLTFQRATRAQVPLKLGIVGPSGSGKTTAALKMARGLVGPAAPIALLDTENGSASLYADITEFDVLNMNPPYQVAKFLGAIDAAAEGGYRALIIDSASHEWIQILQDKEAMDARGGNQWTNWASFTKQHEQLLAAIRTAPIHLILCLRAKEKHEMNDQKKVVKMGMGSQMRDGFEYELTTVFDLAMDHSAKVSKDRTRLFDGRLEPITEKTGQELAQWLTSGKALAANTGEGFKAAEVAQPGPTQASAAVPPTPTATSTPSPEPPAEWVAALVELAEVSVGMDEKTRKALIADFEQEGPSALPAVKEEIAKLRFILHPETIPTTAGEVFAQMDRPEAQPVSQQASDFVDGLDPLPTYGTDPTDGGISPVQYEALNVLIGAYKINRDALRSYMAKANHLLPGANGPTLARMKAEEFAKLRDKLVNQTIAGKGETWSQRTVRVINSTPITTYSPVPAAS